MASDRENVVGTAYVLIALTIILVVLLYLFSVFVYPKIKDTIAPRESTPTVKIIADILCLYKDADSGIAKAKIDVPNIVKLADIGMTPLGIAENITGCFKEKPPVCFARNPDGSCSDERPWDRSIKIDYVSDCPYNTEKEGLNGHIVCEPHCDNFTSGVDYNLRIVSTLPQKAPLPDFCLFYEEAPA